MQVDAFRAKLNNNQELNFKGGEKAAKNSLTMISDKAFHRLENLNGVGQRAILGATAFATQPFIDYYNPRADEKTRKYSVLKTVVKIAVGTAVGCAVRYGAIRLAKNMVEKNPEKLINKVKKPELKEQLKKTLSNDKDRESFIGNFGTILGIIGVVTSDLLIDMPLAKFLIEKSATNLGLSTPSKEDDNA